MAIKLSSKRCEEIEQIVTDMFVKYKISCIPISGFEIASRMGIPVIPYSSFSKEKRKLALQISEDGFCKLSNTGLWTIYYNDAMHYGRVNNTIMHEIGHIVLDHTEASELAEKEVLFFAKYALVPPVLIYKSKLDNANDIAKRFAVSHEAAVYAYNYYQKWLRFGGSSYKKYELTQLHLFSHCVS